MNRRLSIREKVLLSLAVALLVLVGGWNFYAEPTLAEIERLDKTVDRTRRETTQLAAILQKCAELKARSAGLADQLSKRETNFSLAGYIEEQVKASGLRSRLELLRPLPDEDASEGLKRISVELKLKDADMDGLVKLLYRLEFSDRMLTVTRLQILSPKQKLSVNLRVMTLVKAG